MALLPQGEREQRMILVGLLSFGLAAAYYLLVHSPRSLELDGVQAHVEKLAELNQRAKAEMAKGSVEQLQEEARRSQENLELMRRLVPTGAEVPALLEQVSTAARQVGLDIVEVQPEPVIPGDDFDTYRYKIAVVGGFHELGRFVTNVGSLTRIVAPMNAKMQPLPANVPAARRFRGIGQPIDAEFHIQTYVAKAPPPGRGDRS